MKTNPTKEQENSTKRFVVDTNVLVAAIKPFSKPSRSGLEGTKSLQLLVHLIEDDGIVLHGNPILLEEYRRFSNELRSKTSELILKQLLSKVRIVPIREEALTLCRVYLPENESADMVHACTCLVSGAVLITNDGDFDKIRHSRIITVWSVAEAIRRML
ncbi:MAG: PIN domain-containing protein [Nitrososphaerales archaeon]